MLEKQGQDVRILDLRKLTAIADYFVVCTGSVDVHLKAVMDNVLNATLEHEDHRKPLRLEGYKNLQWILADYGDVVAHVFLPETREFYQLEKLWGDAPTEIVSDDE